MCGIAGIADFSGGIVNPTDLQAMCAAMVHRGPDDEGIYIGQSVGLAMRRLAIIDLQTGHQPIKNEDGSVWAVLNGEIYNYRELRRELEGKGHTFTSATDTEVIVHLYEEHGPRCVDKLRGMFGLAVWDERARRLLLARDRLGIKPLFYAWIGQRLLFASELKALLALDEVRRSINWQSLCFLLTFETTPPDESIIAGVHKLETGRLLVASADGPERAESGGRITRYWEPRFTPDYTRSMEDTVDRLRELLEESVRLHLMSDVPLGAFLSGGVDSSSVVATMARLIDRPVKTFSIGFPEPEFDERRFARQVSQAFGTEHHELIVEPDALQFMDDLAWFLDEPFGDPSSIPTYIVSQLAAQHVKVALSGDGGDELFGGYDKYRVEQRERKIEPFARPFGGLFGAVAAALPEGATGRRFLRRRSLTGADRYIDAGTLFSSESQRKLLHGDVLAAIRVDEPARAAAAALGRVDQHWGHAGHWLAPLQKADLEGYLPLDILTKVDRMSMAHSLEARVPLLDHVFVDFVTTIPTQEHLRGASGKLVFKRAMRGILPDEIIDRPKKGFAVPLSHWFRGRLGNFVRDVLLGDTCRQRRILQPAYVEKLIAMHEGGRDLDFQLWTLVSFELWCRTFLDGNARHHTLPATSSVPGTVIDRSHKVAAS